MFIQMLRNHKKSAALYFLVIFVAISLVFLAITLYTQTNVNTLERLEIKSNEDNLISAEKTIIINKLNGIVSDVLYIADTLRVMDMGENEYAELQRLWVAFSNRRGMYDQIRYLDTEGNEVIRINNVMGYAIAEPAHILQYKGDRYYFTDTITLEKNQIYISRMDLNIENGAIEQPIKPVLRMATPYFGNDGESAGVIILNYAAADLFSEITSIAVSSRGMVFLLNEDGYWLYHGEDRGKEWGFMYDDRADESFAVSNPEEWERMTDSSDGYFITEKGVFNYVRLVPGEEIVHHNGVTYVLCKSGPLYIVSYIPLDSETEDAFSNDLPGLVGTVLIRYWIVYLLVAAVSLLLAVALVVNKTQNKEIRYFSEYDAMTGVYNRRAGYRKLNELKKDAARKNCRIAICFIDINGLKEVNDQLGHDMGDALIQSVVGEIRDCVRDNDFIARLGGDEFLIVFEGLDAEGAEKVWGRIAARYEGINAGETRPYVVSVSHGIALFRCDSTETVDEIINRADTAMYAEKREIKEKLRVIREPK